MERLLEYHMKHTDTRIAELRQDLNGQLDEVHRKLDDLTKFKIEMVASARMTSLIVSAICGLVTLVASAWLSSKGFAK